VPASDDDRVAAAQAYIDALVSHDADKVPFAPDCTRVEIGVKTGFSGDHLRRSLPSRTRRVWLEPSGCRVVTAAV